MGFFSGLGSALVGGAFGLLGGKSDNDASAKAAQTANAFTTEQLQNRHQWEVNDLRKAGLNPILSAGGTPSIGSSAQANVFSSTDRAVSGANSATAAKRIGAEIDNLIQDTNLKEANASYAREGIVTQKAEQALKADQAAAARSQVVANQASAVNSAAAAKNYQVDTQRKNLEIPVVAAQSLNSAKEANTWTNKYIRPHTKAWADAIGDWTGAIGNVFRGSTNHSTISK